MLVAAVLLAIGYPLFQRPKETKTWKEGDDYHNLLYAKDAALLAIKELDFDYDTGKVGEEDYRQIKKQYEGEAIAIMKQLDEVEERQKERSAGET
jgi:DNA polymerase II large subunit